MDTKKVCCFLNLYPNGIESMSMDIPGLVQTSCNLGIFKVGETGLAGSGSVQKLGRQPQAAAHPENPVAHRKPRRHALRHG